MKWQGLRDALLLVVGHSVQAFVVRLLYAVAGALTAPPVADALGLLPRVTG